MSQQTKLILGIVGGIILVVAIWVLLFMSRQSTIVVSVSNQDGAQPVTVRVFQGDQTLFEQTSNDPRTELRTSTSGTLHIHVSQPDRGVFMTVEPQGFLRTTQANAVLERERERRFVADNPGPCVDVLQDVLSHLCGAGQDTLVVHTPATTVRPGFTEPLYSARGLYSIEDTAYVGGSLVGLMSRPDETNTGQKVYFLTELGPDAPDTLYFVARGGISSRFNIAPYRDGTLVYNATLEQALYYPTLSTQSPETLEFNVPADNGLTFAQLASRGSSLLLVYSDSNREFVTDEFDTERELPGSGESQIFQLTDNTINGSVRIPFSDVEISYCGTSSVCTHWDGIISVYDNIFNDATPALQIPQVSLYTLGDPVLFETDGALYQVDADTQSATMAYNSNSYTPCGLHNPGGAALVCVTSPANSSHLIVLDDARLEDDAVGIDQQIVPLFESPLIETVSINNTILYVVPAIEGLTQNPATGLFTYPPGQLTAVNASVTQLITSLGLRDAYTVINPLSR